MSDINILKREILAEKKYKLEELTYTFTSTEDKVVERTTEIYQRPDASTIFLYDPEERKILLTQQVRLPAFINGGQAKLLETCAGLINEGEDPHETILREIKEETGYEISSAEKIFEVYTSPGGNTERVHYFISKYSQKDKKTAGGGKKAEGENIELVEWTFDEAKQHLLSGKINDVKLVIFLQYALLNGLLT